ncbi:MAG: hypothetical protein ACLR1E_05770 [Coprococcus sp.]|jgi:hypothetical protein
MDKKQFKEMTIKQKLRWFFGYYGVTVIVAAIAIFVAVVFIKTVFGPSDLEDLCVLVYSDTVSQEQCISYEEEIEDSTGKTASVTAYNITDPYGSQAFATKIGCDVVDLVIAPKKEMELMAQTGYLLSYGIIENSTLYMGIPKTARRGNLLEEAIDYFNIQFDNERAENK